jgi:hypothetical protein
VQKWKPNDCGVYSEGHNDLVFTGKHGKAMIILVYCDDGFWRFGLEADLKDTIDTYHGFGFYPAVEYERFQTREVCLEVARRELEAWLSKDRGRNPKGVSEVAWWIDSMKPKSAQLSLF